MALDVIDRGSKVKYLGKWWRVERVIAPNVYRLGRKESFADMVPRHLLQGHKR